MVQSIQDIHRVLVKSKLFSQEQARKLLAAWQERSGDNARDASSLLSFLVDKQHLTKYQADRLSRGRTEGFFLGDYSILDRLSTGRASTVYRARHQTGQVVAIKVFPPSRARQSPVLARFLKEAESALRLHHPHVVRSFDVFQAHKLHFLVMEYVKGPTLQDYLVQRGRLPSPEAVRLIHQALKGLDKLHQQGLVHGELAPSDLMLTPSPQLDSFKSTLKIVGLGLGLGIADCAEDGKERTSEIPRKDTLAYRAPECFQNPRRMDIRSDIYSLGCILHETLTGQAPFVEENGDRLIARHASEAPRSVREIDPSIPEGLEQVLGWLLAKDPSQRYPTPERAAQALGIFLESVEPPSLLATPDETLPAYLDWLGKNRPAERSSASEVASGGGSSGSQTLAIPPPLPSREAPKASGPPPMVRQDISSDEKKVAKLSTGELPFVEVELVGADPLGNRHSPRGSADYRRRDWIMFFLGIFAGLAAYFLGKSGASLMRRVPPSEEEQ